jgi:hypothetical protein
MNSSPDLLRAEGKPGAYTAGGEHTASSLHKTAFSRKEIGAAVWMPPDLGVEIRIFAGAAAIASRTQPGRILSILPH